MHAQPLGQKMPFIASPSPDRAQHGLGVHGIGRAGGALYDYFEQLAARLRRVRVVCGDFGRVLGDSVTWRHGMTAVMLDPPYADDAHAVSYSGGGKVWDRVTAWCEANGDNPLLRICLAGYIDTWDAPAGWSVVRWRTSGGYGSQGNARGRENAAREALWFSPACLDPAADARASFSQPIRVRESDYAGTLFEEDS
jgi:DNA adenine methylase